MLIHFTHRIFIPNDKLAIESILGLGDIVLPGMLVTFCQRCDLAFKEKVKQSQLIHKKSTGIYSLEAHSFDTNSEKSLPNLFHWSLTAYVLSLVFALAICSFMNTPQPALLYIIPGTLLPVIW